VRTRQQPEREDQRVSFFFDFLKQALRQAETTFRLSVIFMSAGAVILIVGGGLALANQHSSYLPTLTSLSGLLITSCGGAFAVHSNRARKHLTQQANPATPPCPLRHSTPRSARSSAPRTRSPQDQLHR
jgi:hypothetical protein